MFDRVNQLGASAGQRQETNSTRGAQATKEFAPGDNPFDVHGRLLRSMGPRKDPVSITLCLSSGRGARLLLTAPGEGRPVVRCKVAQDIRAVWSRAEPPVSIRHQGVGHVFVVAAHVALDRRLM